MEGAYSGDLHQRILRALDRGLLVWEVSALFEVSTLFIYKALIRWRTTGETGARGVLGSEETGWLLWSIAGASAFTAPYHGTSRMGVEKL
jgi:transposase